jgi:hypothetical protein
MRGLAVFFVASLAAVPAFFFQAGAGSRRLFISGEDAGFLEPSSCAPCHLKIYESYRRTGMDNRSTALDPKTR